MKIPALALLLLAVPAAFASDLASRSWPPALAADSWAFDVPAVPAAPLRTGAARAGGESAPVEGYLSVWTQDCPAGACALPQSQAPARKVGFELGLPASAGEARAKTVVEEFDLPGLGLLAVKLSFYAICPYGSSSGCPARYFQAQAELSGPAAAFCAASLNAADFLPFPVLICAGYPRPEMRLGVTLHRQPL